MKFVLTGIDEHNPETQKNGGGRVMLYLRDLLLLAGYDCEINTPAGAEDIVVYPDCVQGNPLDARRVLRYMLYFWSGSIIPKSDCVIVYHPAYFEQVASRCEAALPRENIVTLPNVEPGLFYPEPKTIESVLYTGKETVKERPATPMPVITKGNMSREQCAAMLRKSKNLYLMDHYCVMADEARLCGCVPWNVMNATTFVPAPATNAALSIMDPMVDVAQAHRFMAIAKQFFNLDESAFRA